MLIEFINVWSGKTNGVIEEYLREEAQKVDVFCFQEADREFPEIAKRALGDCFAVQTAYKKVDDNDIFPQAIYTRKGLRIYRTETVIEEIPNVGLGLGCQIKNGNRMIEIANIHGISRPGNKLDSEARIIQSGGIIEHFRERNRSVIIGGDFNLEKGTESVKMFTDAGYGDLINDFGIRTTRNEIIWKKYPNTPQYYSDYVFVGPDIKVKNFEVVDNLVSDHLPMILEIED